MPHDATLLGPLSLDLLVKGDGPPDWQALLTWEGAADFELAAAGSVGYTARRLATLGLSVSVTSCLSDDALGSFIDEALRRAGVDTTFVPRVAGTVGGIGVYLLLFGGSKRPLVYRAPTHPAWPLTFAPDVIARLLDARLLHIGGYLHHAELWHGAACDLLRQAKARGLITSLDPQFPLTKLNVPWMPAVADLLPAVDLLLCDEREARGLTGRVDLTGAAQCLLDAGVGTLVVKRGAHGSIVYSAGQRCDQAAVVFGEGRSAVGAGDVYDAGFLFGGLRGWPPADCALFASVAAGYAVAGASPDLPTLLAEMERRRSAASA